MQPQAGGAIETRIAARSRELFAYVTGTEHCSISSASALADRIEDSLWHAGERVPANEAELSETFCVGRRMVRQASRVLQQRCVMEPRRGGRGSGGLKPIVPDAPQLARALADAVRAQCDRRAIEEARSFLAPLLARRSGPLAALLSDMIASLARDSHQPVVEQLGPQASSLAQQLIRGSAGDFAAAPLFIGSFDSIAERYGVSHETVVEAVRLLEDRQLVALRRGRGGGVYLSNGSTARVARMANAFLAGNHIPLADCQYLLLEINVEMINLACRREQRAGADGVLASLNTMDKARTASEVAVAWYPVQREIAELAQSPILHVFARCLAASLVLRRLHAAEIPEADAHDLYGATRSIVDNVVRGKSNGNRDAHVLCQHVLGRYW